MDVDGMVAAVQRLVRIPSWSGDETPAQEAVAELMEGAGLTVDLWEIDLAEVQRHPLCSWEIERDRALGLVGSLGPDGRVGGPGADASAPEGGSPSVEAESRQGRGRPAGAEAGAGRTLLLNGHVDVVPPGDEGLWTHPPFAGVVRDGSVWGRGSLDMKGPLMAGLFALKALKDASVRLKGAVRLQSVVAEEDGGLGTLATILRGYRGDGAVVMEPTELAVAPVQAGCMNFRIHVPGRAAHGAVREEGVSAFEKLFAVYGAVQALEARRNRRAAADPLFARYRIPYPISIGTLRGGDWASSVPDHAVMEGRFGVRPDEEPDVARLELEQAVAEAAAGDPFLRDQPPRVEWWGGRFLAAATDPGHPLVGALRSAATATSGRSVPVEGVPFGADAGLLQRVGGTPAVLFGAGDIRLAHRPDEHVQIADLAIMARALAVAALRFCGSAGPRGGSAEVR